MVNKITKIMHSIIALMILTLMSNLSYAVNTKEQVAEALREWNGSNVQSLVKTIKEIAPDQGVIEAIRAVDKIYNNDPVIGRKIAQYQKLVKKTLIDVRINYLNNYVKNNRVKSRSIYGFGDIGSWAADGEIGAAADFDWTVFGVDKNITKEVADGYGAELAQTLGLSGSANLNLFKEFDIVVTPEGHEESSGVYGNQGSIKWASRKFDNFTLLTVEGGTRKFINQDVIAERSKVRKMEELRSTMSQEKYGNAYEILFDERGRFQLENQDQLTPEAKSKLAELLGKFDMYKASGEINQDVIAERSKARKMAELRSTMSQEKYGNAYEILFDERGRFQLENQDQLTPEAKSKLAELLGKFDMYKASGEINQDVIAERSKARKMAELRSYDVTRKISVMPTRFYLTNVEDSNLKIKINLLQRQKVN